MVFLRPVSYFSYGLSAIVSSVYLWWACLVCQRCTVIVCFPSVAILAQDSIGFSCKLVPRCGVWSPALSFLSAVVFLKVSLNSCVQVRCGVWNLPMVLPVEGVHCIPGVKYLSLVGTIDQSVGASTSTGSPTSSVPSSSESNVNISSTQFYATLTQGPGSSWLFMAALGICQYI